MPEASSRTCHSAMGTRTPVFPYAGCRIGPVSQRHDRLVVKHRLPLTGVEPIVSVQTQLGPIHHNLVRLDAIPYGRDIQRSIPCDRKRAGGGLNAQIPRTAAGNGIRTLEHNGQIPIRGKDHTAPVALRITIQSIQSCAVQRERACCRIVHGGSASTRDRVIRRSQNILAVHPPVLTIPLLPARLPEKGWPASPGRSGPSRMPIFLFSSFDESLLYAQLNIRENHTPA